MKQIEYNNTKGVFFTMEEYELLKERIIANRVLIQKCEEQLQ